VRPSDTDIFAVPPTHRAPTSDGGTVISYVLPGATVAIRYVNRPSGATGPQSAAWFRTLTHALCTSSAPAVWLKRARAENYLNAVNAQYQTSYKSCWPVWGDNHYCYDSWTGDISDIAAKYEKNKGKPGYVYHPFKMPSGPPPGRRLDEGPGGIFCNGYFGEPSGWQFQLDGEYSNCPADAEQFMPNYCYTGCEQNATVHPQKNL